MVKSKSPLYSDVFAIQIPFTYLFQPDDDSDG